TDFPAMLCALALVVLRGWGKVLGGRAARRLAPMLPLPLEPGFALLSPAPIAMCMLAELSHLLSLPFSARLVDLGVLSALACEIASAAMVRKSAVEPLPVIEEAQP